MFLKRLSPRTLFSLSPSSLPSPFSIFVAQCSSSSPSHLTYPHSHGHPDPRNVRVSVWWDLDNCAVPPGVNVFRGAQAITAAIKSSAIKGPIQIRAFGDLLRFVRTNEALSSTGICLTHITHDGKYSAHNSHIQGLMFWLYRNPPPAHLFLIIADESCAGLVHQLRNKNYNILLATKEPAPNCLCSAATIVWSWDALVRGENLTGKYFNRPPNCPWYDQYDGPLENLFTEIESPEALPEIFSQDSFWEDLETFFNTEIGQFIIKESSTRRKMSYWLKEYGPSVVRSLEDSDLFLLLDLLISKNNWVLDR